MNIKIGILFFSIISTGAFGYSLPVSDRYTAECEKYKELRLDSLTSERSKTWLFSFPRSGNTWIRYCIEVLTKRPTFDAGRMNLPTHLPMSLLLDYEIDVEKEPIFKAHFLGEMRLDQTYHQDDKLIIILRNPKEIFLRHKGKLPQEEEFTNAFKWYEITFSRYFEIINLYESWDTNKRLLLYYEDIITQPRMVLETLLNFFGESLEPLDKFFNNFEHHRKESIGLYIHHGGTKSSSVDATYYSKEVEQQALKEFDALIEKSYPHLYRTYLKERYAER